MQKQVTDLKTIDEAYQYLAGEICAKAAKDYANILKSIAAGHEQRKADLKPLEQFFRSEWFLMLSGGMNGEFVMEAIQCRVKKN